MVKKILSYLLSLVIAFNLPLKKSDAKFSYYLLQHFFIGMYVGYLLERGLNFKVDRSHSKAILEWQLKNIEGKQKDNNVPIEESIAVESEKDQRLFYLVTAAVWSSMGLAFLQHVSAVIDENYDERGKKSKENLSKQKEQHNKVDNEQKN